MHHLSNCLFKHTANFPTQNTDYSFGRFNTCMCKNFVATDDLHESKIIQAYCLKHSPTKTCQLCTDLTLIQWSALGGGFMPILPRIFDAGPGPPSCVLSDSMIFLTKLISTSTGWKSSSSSKSSKSSSSSSEAFGAFFGDERMLSCCFACFVFV